MNLLIDCVKDTTDASCERANVDLILPAVYIIFRDALKLKILSEAKYNKKFFTVA